MIRARMRRRIVASVALAAIGAAAPALGAGAQLPNRPGRLIVEPFRGFTWIHDPVERHAQEALAKHLLEVLERDPAISHPVGYDVALGLRAGDMPDGFNAGMKYFTGVAGEVRIYGQGTDDNGKPAIVQVDAVDLRAFVNDRWCGRGNYTESDSLPDHGLPIVEGMQPTPALHGHPTTDGMCVLIADRPQPPFLSLSRDRYRRVQILQMRVRLKRDRAQMADMLADPNYRVTAKAMLDTAQRFIDSLQTVADAADAADRDAPAAVVTNGPGDSSLVARGTDDSYPLDVPNPAYYDPALPRDRAQSIVLRLPYGVPGVTPYSYEDDDGARRAVFTAIVKGLPWTELEAMVKR
ncbi:MAG TPA: hypothetical protein VFT41_03350 [Gemmatimonadaceae bacterium]|nr:hypothetical protein [Gemmatimonadaceae bacterium]